MTKLSSLVSIAVLASSAAFSTKPAYAYDLYQTVFNTVDSGYDSSVCGDWAWGSYKTQCPKGYGVIGVSQTATGSSSALHHTICASDPAQHFAQNSSCHGVLFPLSGSNPSGNNPNPWGSLFDFDQYYYKIECASGEYVAGVAETTTGRPSGILCCPFSGINTSSYEEFFANQNSTDYASPDWDIGYYKGQCPTHTNYQSPPAVAFGISVDTSVESGHELYCLGVE